jgi:hypothetical protein
MEDNNNSINMFQEIEDNSDNEEEIIIHVNIIRGKVRCSKLPHFRGDGLEHPNGTISKEWPKIPGYTNINVCSNGTRYRSLSPMLLGPFTITEDRVPIAYYPDGIHPGFQPLDDKKQIALVSNIENFHQGSKCYNIDIIDNIIQKSFYERRAKLFKDPKGRRRAIPKKSGYPVCACINGTILSYVASRYYYISYYEKMVSMTSEFKELLQRIGSGENINILGFDGRDPVSNKDSGLNDVTYESLDKELYNPQYPFGHELVLCGMLLDYKPWLNFDISRT